MELKAYITYTPYGKYLVFAENFEHALHLLKKKIGDERAILEEYLIVPATIPIEPVIEGKW